MNDEQIAEKVAQRFDGKKEYEVLSSEVLHYSRTIWATSKEEAEEICSDEGDWGDICSSRDFTIDGIKEV